MLSLFFTCYFTTVLPKIYKTVNFMLSILQFHMTSFFGNAYPSQKNCNLYTLFFQVMYLDFVDFGPRRLPNTLPRICVWKGNMLKTYSDLDLKPNCSYGFCHVLDFSDTCYSKVFPSQSYRYQFSCFILLIFLYSFF